MNRVHPLRVPWSISPSTPRLRVSIKDIEGRSHGVITFLGYFGAAADERGENSAYYHVAVLMEDVVSVTYYPEFSPTDSVRLDTYDWSIVPEFRDLDGSLKNYVSSFHAEWNSKGICPDPAAYEVLESDWLRCVFFDHNESVETFHHYLFVGEDHNVEAIARSFNWNVLRGASEDL